MKPLDTWISTLAIFAGLLMVQYALNCYLIYTRASHPLHVLWTEHTSDASRHFSGFDLSNLEQLGFTLAGYVVRSEDTRLRCLAMFVHPQNKDSAELFASDGQGSLALPIFKSRFEDGFAFEVGSSRVAPHEISGGPDFPAFNFPQAQSTVELYRMHCLLKKQYSKSRVPVVADGTGELREFSRRAEEVHNYSMSRPGYKLNPTGTRYAYTLAGAMRAALRHQWPINAICRWSTLLSARRHARELESYNGQA